MKKTNVKKIVQFKSCNNNDIANSVLSLSEPLLMACGDDQELKEIIISLAVTGWNLSLFQDTEENYLKKIDEKIPEAFNGEKRKVFSAFILQIIQKKQAEFGGMKKGITKHSVTFDNKAVSLKVETLPVNPKHT